MTDAYNDGSETRLEKVSCGTVLMPHASCLMPYARRQLKLSLPGT